MAPKRALKAVGMEQRSRNRVTRVERPQGADWRTDLQQADLDIYQRTILQLKDELLHESRLTADLTGRVAQLEREVAKWRYLAHIANVEADLMRNSVSWRMTLPLRQIPVDPFISYLHSATDPLVVELILALRRKPTMLSVAKTTSRNTGSLGSHLRDYVARVMSEYAAKDSLLALATIRDLTRRSAGPRRRTGFTAHAPQASCADERIHVPRSSAFA